VAPGTWTNELVSESKKKLSALTARDDARKANEAALNELETYIYKVKNTFADEEEVSFVLYTWEEPLAYSLKCCYV
jgi:hypothetical protein